MLACGTDQALRMSEILAPRSLRADLDRLQAEVQAAIDVLPDLVGRLAERIDRAVGCHAVTFAPAEQLDDRLPRRLSANVPQRDVDRRNRVDDGAAPAVIAGCVVHQVPQRLALQ